MKTPLLFFSVVSLLSAEAGNLTREASIRPSIKPGHETKAVISGVESNGSYTDLPPVLVELSDLPVGAAVWVEVQRDSHGAAPTPPVTVDSKFFLRRGTTGVLNIGGLHQVCETEGTWTMTVLMSNARGTTPLGSKTFRLRSGSPTLVAAPVPALQR